MYNVLFVGSEATPFIKTGGLADVIGSLPKAINETGDAEVSVILPLYRDIKETWRKDMQTIASVEVSLGWRQHQANLLTYVFEGVRFYFIENDFYFGRDGIYGYMDDGERFVFFNKAVLECLPHLYQQPDVLHAHDWHAALSVALLKTFQSAPSIKTVLTIHNLKFQGKMEHDAFFDLINLPPKHFSGFEWDGMVNCLKAGLFHADHITTVSPSYAEEIKTSYFGEGLDPILLERANDLSGILNGIDTESYNSATDDALYTHFQYHPTLKQANKRFIQEKFGLPVRDDVPLYAVISRLTEQKGFHLLTRVASEFLEQDVQLVVLGTGESRFEHDFTQIAEANPTKMVTKLMFDEQVARQLYAAADFFIMPSKFEPCGLAQLIALQYKTAPIVRETGGLKDTVQPFNEYDGSGNGFCFSNYNAHDLLNVLRYSFDVYHDCNRFSKLYDNLTGHSFTWFTSAKSYVDVYKSLCRAESYELVLA
ncbi:glycogen synthase [Texcoconibacillus texcoconensis]|uniref:Glycogen synthase n=1 Tax=Texcoconibacillus texcoconensis TaxID=1095777 RepID=A0A840QTN8_9BACI|nr:glycogen/starch synthase [Texcoconibacillus texcoconensis]MBB5174735.1 starch synthase [Texcoconibacillus texcoconensis]